MNDDTIITVDDDYRFTIPGSLRDALGWRPGTRLALLPQPDGTVLIEEVETPPNRPVSERRRKPRR